MFRPAPLPSKQVCLALAIFFGVLTIIVLAVNAPSICTTTFLGCAVLYGIVWFFKSDRDRRRLQQARQSQDNARTLAARTPPAKSSPDSSSFDFE